MGHPGTLLTFFVCPDINKGNPGTGQVTTVAFLIPLNAIKYWTDRLRRNVISFVDPSTRFDGTEPFIAFHDPDGMMLELIAPSAGSTFFSSNTQSKEIHEDDNNILAINYDNVWKEGPVNPQHAIRGVSFSRNHSGGI